MKRGLQIAAPHPIQPTPIRTLLAPALSETHALGEVGTGRRVVRRDHRIVVRETPFLAVVLGLSLIHI